MVQTHRDGWRSRPGSGSTDDREGLSVPHTPYGDTPVSRRDYLHAHRGCGPECEPWIAVSHCGAAKYDPDTGELRAVRCPSRYCADAFVSVVGGRIAAHNGPTALPGVCPWAGIHIVDDRTDSRFRDSRTSA
ncbi:hypothetical protein [Nocardia barduliensis]|uniref:hypothetical protein n=1 Tax=Nocardia barduliensis TaxID=2736643 RepID=UPI00157285FB|nr:hypothetical protein [Nocardia barduliensis]